MENENLQPQMIPDVILASQWESVRPLSPEQRLCLALLREALNCLDRRATITGANRLRDKTIPRSRIALEAWEWFFSEESGAFSFEFVCEALRVNPQWMRKGLQARYQVPVVIPPRRGHAGCTLRQEEQRGDVGGV